MLLKKEGYLWVKKMVTLFSETQSRRPIVIRQILCNKRTVSNLYWGMQYHILDWLNVEPTLDEKSLIYK